MGKLGCWHSRVVVAEVVEDPNGARTLSVRLGAGMAASHQDGNQADLKSGET